MRLPGYVVVTALLCFSVFSGEYSPPTQFSTPPAERNISKNCGPHSLCVAARLMGVRCTLNDVLALFEEGDRGVSIADVAIAARRLGLKALPCKVDVAQIESIEPPIIAYLPRREESGQSTEGHFLVLSYADDSVVQLLSPPLEPILVPHEKLRKVWQGHAIVFERNAKSFRFGLLRAGVLLVLIIAASAIVLSHLRKRSRPRKQRIMMTS